MSTLEFIYLACAIGGAVIFLLRMILMVIGGIDGGDASADSADLGDTGSIELDEVDLTDASLGGGTVDMDGSDGSLANTDMSFRFLSVQGVSAFIMMFGIVGLAIAKAPIHPIFSLAAGIGAGLFTVWIISLIFAAATGLQSDGTMRMKSAVGEIATVYLRIPANDTGKVQVVVQGALRVLEAVSEDGEMVPTSTRVKVVGVRDTALVIRILHPEEIN